MENQINVGDQNTQQIGQNPVVQPVQIPENPKVNYWMISIIALLFLLLGTGGFLLVNRDRDRTAPNFSSNQGVPAPTTTVENQEHGPQLTTEVKTNSDISFKIPSEWLIKFNKNTNEKLSVEISDWDWELTKQFRLPSNYIQIKLEIYDNNERQNLKSLSEKYSNIYLIKDKEYSIKSNEFNFLVWEGKETFSQKPRFFKQYLTTYRDKVILVRAFSPNLLPYNHTLDDLAFSLSGRRSTSLLPIKDLIFDIKLALVPGVKAQDHPSLTYQGLTVMGDKNEDTFSIESYNGELAKGYVFSALQGQRLTTVVEETTGYSYIHSYLFDEVGNLIKGPLDTRIEFNPTYSGKYYLVVTNFRNKENLNFKVWVEDRNQTDFVIKIKDYQTGIELFFPHEQGLRTVPFEKFSYLIDFNGLTTPSASSPRVYTMPGIIEEFNNKAFFPESDEKNLVRTQYQPIDPETINFFAINESGHIIGFPDKSQLVLVLTLGPTSGYIDRLFTDFQEIAEYKPSTDTYVGNPLGEQEILAIMYNFRNEPDNKPFTKEDVYNKIFGQTNSANSYFGEASYGKTWLKGEVVGWFTVPYDSGPSCISNLYELHEMVKNSGVNLDIYKRIIYLHPFRECDGTSASTGGNPSTVNLNGFVDLYALTHELGHNLTLGHSHYITCGNQSIDNYNNCVVTRYGDSFTPMGHSAIYDFNGFHKASLGWIPQSNIKEASENGTSTLTPIEITSNGVQILKIKKPDTNEYYYLEYRRPIGLDSNLPSSVANGAMLHVGYYLPFFGGGSLHLTPETYLIDIIPGGNYDSFQDNRSFYDPVNKIKITQVKHNDNEVTLDIKFNVVE